jgi:alcohol dehydrogenase
MSLSFSFRAPTQIMMSDDCARTLSDVLESERPPHVAIVVDRNVMAVPAVDASLAACRKIADRVTVLPVDSREPDTDFVDEQAAPLRNDRPDLLVGIGGGSVLDLAKALGVLAWNTGTAADYQGRNLVPRPGCTIVMMPTTAGTGSEVTPGAVVVNPATKRKGAISSPYMVPRYAILDPALSASMPPGVAASTGMDALAHAVESFAARCATPMTRMYSREAFRLISRSLPALLRDAGSGAHRADQQLGATLAGIAICNSDTGACHAMAYPLGIYAAVPHGTAVGLLLPEVMARNIAKGARAYAALADLLPTAAPGDSDEIKSRKLHAFVSQVVPAGMFGRSLADFGVRRSDVPFLAERGLDLKTALASNPVDFAADDARWVLERLVADTR